MGTFSSVEQGRTAEYELAAAGSLIMTVPVVIFQKYFIRGLTAGAFK